MERSEKKTSSANELRRTHYHRVESVTHQCDPAVPAQILLGRPVLQQDGSRFCVIWYIEHDGSEWIYPCCCNLLHESDTFCVRSRHVGGCSLAEKSFPVG